MKVGYLIGVAAIALVLSGCGQAKSGQQGGQKTLHWTENAELAGNDLSKVTDVESFNVLLNTQSGLYRATDHGNRTVNDLAKSTKISDHGKKYVIQLRHAKWSNGDPITAKDFVYSWRRTIAPKTASQNAYYMYSVKNAKAINKGKKSPTTLGIKANGNNQLTIQLVRPVSYFKKLLAWPTFFPLNEKVVKKYGSRFGTSATKNVYSGPFVLKGWNGTNDHWELQKNSHYWDRKHVRLNKITEAVVKDPQTGLNQYQSGKLDRTILSGSQVKNYRHNKDFVSRRMSETLWLSFNQKKVKAFRNQAIRKAFSLAVNRHQLVNNVLADGSLAAKGYTPVGLSKNPKNGTDFTKDAYVKGGVQYDLKAAKKLLAKGYRQAGIKSVSIGLKVPDTSSDKEVAEFIQSQLQKLPGVKIAVQSVPNTALLSQQSKGDFQLTLEGWQPVFSDPIEFLDIWTSTNSFNTGGWHDTQYDQLIDQAENQLGNQPYQRWQKLVAAEKRLMTHQAMIPLYQAVQPQLEKSTIKGINYNPSGVPYDWKDTYFAK